MFHVTAPTGQTTPRFGTRSDPPPFRQPSRNRARIVSAPLEKASKHRQNGHIALHSEQVGHGQASLGIFANFALQREGPIHAELNQHEWGLLASRLRQEPAFSTKPAGG